MLAPPSFSCLHLLTSPWCAIAACWMFLHTARPSVLSFPLFVTLWRTFWIFPQGHHWSCQTPAPPTPFNQFASSKTNIVFNQMQLSLQVKISFQLKLIRPIMSLEESWVTTACIGSPLVTNNSASQKLWPCWTVSYRGAEKWKICSNTSICSSEEEAL